MIFKRSKTNVGSLTVKWSLLDRKHWGITFIIEVEQRGIETHREYSFLFFLIFYFWGITGELKTLIISTASSSAKPTPLPLLPTLPLSFPSTSSPSFNSPAPVHPLHRHASHLILINVFSGEPSWIQMKHSALPSQITLESSGYLSVYTSSSTSLLLSGWPQRAVFILKSDSYTSYTRMLCSTSLISHNDN